MTKGNDYMLSPLYTFILIAFIFAVGILFNFLIPVLKQVFGLGPETSIATGIRVFGTFFFLMIAVPMSVMIESFYSRLKKRRFRWRNFLLLIAPVCEAILVLNIVGLAFEFAFPGLSFSHEPFAGMAGLALGMMVALPVVAIGLTGRRFSAYLRKAFQ
jgi:membrane protease YdiL (CAAX protease family)